jgi:hypothetical protein
MYSDEPGVPLGTVKHLFIFASALVRLVVIVLCLYCHVISHEEFVYMFAWLECDLFHRRDIFQLQPCVPECD